MNEASPDDRFETAKKRFFEGLQCFQAGRYAQAEQHYLVSLALLPGRASTLINLAAAQLHLSRPVDALANADAALAVEPHSADALLRRAQALERLGRASDAIVSYQRALAIDPTQAVAWSGSGTLLRELNRLPEAAHAFREALRLGADPELHAYYLAAVEGRQVPPTAPPRYVQALFDDYADDFETHLVQGLHYSGHSQLVEGLSRVAGPVRWRHALDLGCGTGLCGPLLRPIAERLGGVDLSKRMLDKAAALGVYDHLEHAGIVEHLSSTDERHDLVVAADVFIYIGELAPVFAAVRRVMDGGVFCFSVEVPEGGADFELLPSLRYAHTEPYLRRIAAMHGFEFLAATRAQVRQDQRDSVEALFCYLRTS